MTHFLVWAPAFTAAALDHDVVVYLLAALLLAATSLRFAGRYLADWAFVWVRFRLSQHDDRRLDDDPLRVLAPDFRLRQHHDRAGNAFGVVGVEKSWTAVLRLAPGGEPDLPTLTGLLREACENAEFPLAGAQLLVRTEGTRRVRLVALRYVPSDVPLAALARGGGELGEHRAIIRAALGLAARLGETGVSATVLEAGELATELRENLGVQGDPLARGTVVDGWRSWSAAGTAQTCFTPKTRPDATFTVTARGAAFTVVSYQVHRTSLGRLRAETTIRVVNRGTRRPPRAADLDVPAVALYGRHEASVRRTLPLAAAR